ncbi:hypothetical protein BH23ACT11_BH23ACT11_22140 [soil metagenome]
MPRIGVDELLIDSHTHLLRLKMPPEEALSEARDAGVRSVVNVGTDVDDSRQGVGLAAEFPNVYTSVGIHPHNAGTYSAADLETLMSLTEEPGVVAVGEVGLDYYRNEWPADVQRALFEDAICLANEVRLPLIIHSRRAFAETMASLGNARVPIILHCFEGGELEVQEARERGYYIGLAGNATYQNSETARVLRLMGEDQILVETDAPYLSPQPMRGKPNAPKNVVHTAGFVAERLGLDDEEVAKITARNARNAFGLPAEA